MTSIQYLSLIVLLAIFIQLIIIQLKASKEGEKINFFILKISVIQKLNSALHALESLKIDLISAQTQVDRENGNTGHLKGWVDERMRIVNEKIDHAHSYIDEVNNLDFTNQGVFLNLGRLMDLAERMITFCKQATEFTKLNTARYNHMA